MGPTDFESTVLRSLGKIEEHMATSKATMDDHGKRIDALESARDQEQGEKRAGGRLSGFVKMPLQMASGGALTLLIQKVFGQH